MDALHLQLRTPQGLLYEGAVTRVVAEDRDGWFGLRPGRLDVLAVLPPGLLLFEDEAGEAFVALDEALLDLRAGQCRVLTPVAVVSRDLEAIADEVAARLQSRREREDVQRTLLTDLVREAHRRIVGGGRAER